MEDKIHLSVITGDGLAFEKQVNYVNIPTAFGSVGVLSGHAPMLCAVEAGVLRCRGGEEETVRLRVGAGIANVDRSEVTLLVSDAEELA